MSACLKCANKIKAAGHITHGESKGKRLYSVWAAMLRRCRNKGSMYYGGKGIRVCAEWVDYTKFRAWAISTGYSDDLTIERVDPSMNYEPSNCEWVTQSVNTWRAKHPGYYWRSMTCSV